MNVIQQNIIILNALMLKHNGATNVVLDLTEPEPTLSVDWGDNPRVPQPFYLDGDWETVEAASIELDVSYALFSTDTGLRASVTKDVDGTQVRLVFGVSHNGSEAATILHRILELYVRVLTWTLNPKEPIPGWGKQHDELFGYVD